MPDWSIKIVKSGSGAAFQPDIQGYNPGDPLPAQQDDLVTWNNTTKKKHQPWPTDSNYNLLPSSEVPPTGPNYLSNPIPAGQSSRPSYDVAQPTPPVTTPPTPPPQSWTVYYACKLHPTSKTERGTIEATVYPTD
jgi:hypothetical protein